MHVLHVVNNCLIYCPGYILQNHFRSRPAWADCFCGPPNGRGVLFSSDAKPWNTFLPRALWRSFTCCSGIFLLMELPSLRIGNQGECSSISPLQHALAEHFVTGPTQHHQHYLLLLFHTLSLFFKDFFSPFPSFAGGGSCPGARLGITKVMVIHLHFLQSEHELMGIFQQKTPTYPRLLSSRTLFYKYHPPHTQGRPWRWLLQSLCLRFILLFSFKWIYMAPH